MIAVLLYVIVTLCFLIAAIAYSNGIKAAARAEVIFRHLALFVNQNLPLPMAIRFAAMGERGRIRKTLSQTGLLLESGLSLSEAVRRGFPNCPGIWLSFVQAGERNGALPSMLRQSIRQMQHRRPQDSDSRSRIYYLIGTMLMFVLILHGVSIFTTYFVYPKWRTIFEDFSVPIPTLTQEVFAGGIASDSEPTTVWGWLVRGALVLTGLLPVIAILALVMRLRPRRADNLGPVSRMSDEIRWHAWPFSSIARANACVRSLPVLRLSIAAGWTLPDAIDHAAWVDVNCVWRRRLREWARRIRSGTEALAAGRECKLPDMLLRDLAVGMRDNDLDAALHHAEGYYDLLHQRLKSLAIQVAVPLATLSAAALVALVAVSYVLAIRATIDAVAATWL